MPQIWVTYEELSELLKRDASAVRRAVINSEWPRRRSSDGHTRVKLSPTLAHRFMLNYGAKNGLDLLTNDMTDRLRGLLRNLDGSRDDRIRTPVLMHNVQRIAKE
jgi:hypothetical protein